MNTIGEIVAVLGAVAAGMAVIGVIKKPASIYEDKPEEKNPMESLLRMEMNLLMQMAYVGILKR